MYKLNIEHDAQDDLKSMLERGGDEKRFALFILSLLSEMKADQAILGSLLDHEFENKNFNVNRFQAFWPDRNVWRLKVFEWNLSQTKKITIPYRIIYAYDSECLSFRILAVVHRNFDYANDHSITQRVHKAYVELGLPIYKYTHGGSYRH